MKNLFYYLTALCLIISSCDGDDEGGDDNNNTGQYTFGWNGQDDPSKVPSKIKFGNTTLPSSADLTAKFPPIGDQGQYGTCVAWAVGYNVKTAINGIENNFSNSQLQDSRNQFSPKDLFFNIDDNKKGANCNGTLFDDALDVLQARGIASLATVPYVNMGGCNKNQADPSWNAEAAGNKIKYYRKVEPKVNALKEQIANNIPIILGAKLSDNFMSWNSDEVISSNTTYNNTGQHAYHALAILGYDDNKGPNGAFKVVNSWGQAWGSRGYIWVDYNFMINEFQFGDNFYIAANEKGDGKKPDPTPGGSSPDVAAWVFEDYSEWSTTSDPLARSTLFNVYNIGNSTVPASSKWKIYYIYYNAYDGSDYGVVFYDEFTTNIPANTVSCNGNVCFINYALGSGRNLAETLFGQGNEAIKQTYKMPAISGDYYLLLLVDGDDVLQEDDELNNLFYTSDEPKTFINGYSDVKGGLTSRNKSSGDFHNPLEPIASNIKSCRYNSSVNEKHTNAYTPDEIKSMIKYQKQSGQLEKKLMEYQSQNSHMESVK